MAVYPHGDANRYRHGRCRCRRCRAANTREMNLYRLAVATGVHRRDVDAEPVRQHVAKLQAAGLGVQRIAELAGVGYDTVRRLLYGKPSEGTAPTKKMRPETASKLLAVRFGLLPSEGWVPGVGTRRRVQALSAMGWPLPLVAARCGLSPDTVQRLTRAPDDGRVDASTARKVADLYRRLWCLDPASEGVPAPTVARLRSIAAGKGWVTPIGWGDIDDPDATPDTDAEQIEPRRYALWEDSEELIRGQGLTIAVAAHRLGVTASKLRKERWLVESEIAQQAGEAS
ncbi:hypothetical protein [Nonomuraea wenchangensis]